VTAAIARVVDGAVWPDGRILDIGPISQNFAAPTVGLRVKKSGRNTGLTFGTIKAINVAVDTDASPVACAGTGPLNHRMVNQIKISPDGFAVMTADSGSLVVTDEPGLPRPVGIVWAHSPTFTLACRVDRALALLSQRLGSNLTFPASSSAAGEGAEAAGDLEVRALAGDHPGRAEEIERARAVQERHFDALFNLEDVVGHGISLSEDGEPVIEIYLRRENPRARRQIPPTLENTPTRVVVTGPVVAN
jgi:hypothetical protein